MTANRDILRSKYLNENFRIVSIQDSHDVYTQHSGHGAGEKVISFHYVFYYNTFDELKDYWTINHKKYLVDDYDNNDNNDNEDIDINYNYYAIFILINDVGEIDELAKLAHSIENNMFYSRKYLFNGISSVVIPGVFLEFDKDAQDVNTYNPSDHWEEQLGTELYRKIIGCQTDSELEKAIVEHLDNLVQNLDKH